jgi:Antitoxin to bacterial toxin RNase LS or RnlA
MTTIKHYDLVRSEISDFPFIVFATTGTNPMSELTGIETELSSSRMACEILFDLLLSNGDTSNRFIAAYFDGIHFRSDSFKIIKSLPRTFKQFASNYYARQKSLLPI